MSARQKIEKVIPLCKHCMKRIAWDNGAKSWLHDESGFKYCNPRTVHTAQPARIKRVKRNAKQSTQV